MLKVRHPLHHRPTTIKIRDLDRTIAGFNPLTPNSHKTPLLLRAIASIAFFSRLPKLRTVLINPSPPVPSL
jgi:hypothetical protein